MRVRVAGLGNIGLHIANVCKALGMKVLGLKRTSGSVPSVDVSVKELWTDSFENAIRADRGETPRNLVDLEHGY